MRWDLDSRKVVYEDSDLWFKEQKIRYEQDLNSLKTILSREHRNTKSFTAKTRFVLVAGVVAFILIFAVLVAFQFI